MRGKICERRRPFQEKDADPGCSGNEATVGSTTIVAILDQSSDPTQVRQREVLVNEPRSEVNAILEFLINRVCHRPSTST